jgi:hypothetical protein
MGADFLNAFLSRGRLYDFIPSALDDRGRQEKKFGVVVDNQYLGFISYFIPLQSNSKQETR